MRSAIIVRDKPEDFLIRLFFIDTELPEPVYEIHVGEPTLHVMQKKNMLTRLSAPVADSTYYRYTKHSEGAEVYVFSRVRQRDTENEGFDEARDLLKKIHLALQSALQLFPKNNQALREVHKIHAEIGECLKKTEQTTKP